MKAGIGGISIKSSIAKTIEQTTSRQQRRMTVALTADTMGDYWRTMLDEKGPTMQRLLPTLADATVELRGTVIVIHTIIHYLEVELRPHVVDILEWMRRESGIADLTLAVEVEQMEVEQRPYSTNDKYEAMVKINPALEKLRHVLPNIEM